MLGRTIEIRFAGERSDRYGRLKGHAFLATEDGPVWVQGRLLEMGLARAYALAAHRACEAELLAAERTAREARLGVWGEAAYAVRAAEPSAALLRHLATFQLVEGRVVRVGHHARQRLSQFRAQAARRGFSVSLRLGDRGRLGSFPGKSERSRAARWCACAAGSRSGLASRSSIFPRPADLEVIADGEAAGEPGSNLRADRRPRPK